MVVPPAETWLLWCTWWAHSIHSSCPSIIKWWRWNEVSNSIGTKTDNMTHDEILRLCLICISPAKLRKIERNVKGKLVFLFISECHVTSV